MGGADVTGAKICSAFEPTLQNYVGQPVWMNCASIPDVQVKTDAVRRNNSERIVGLNPLPDGFV